MGADCSIVENSGSQNLRVSIVLKASQSAVAKGDVSLFFQVSSKTPKPKDQKYNEPDKIQFSHHFRQIKSNVKILNPWLNKQSVGPKIYIPSTLHP